MADIEIIRTERRRRYSEAEKAALLAEVDRGGNTVAEVARRHGIAESLLYNWRSHRRAQASVASEPLQFISYGEVTDAVVDLPATVTPPAAVSTPAPPAERQVRSERPASEDLVRPHPGSRPGSIDIELGTGVRLSVDTYVTGSRSTGAIVEVACWVHCRRKLFDEWKDTRSATAHAGVKLIDAIYKAEALARGLPIDERTRMRAASRTAVDAFFRWADEALDGLSAKSDLAKAVRYAVTRRTALTRF